MIVLGGLLAFQGMGYLDGPAKDIEIWASLGSILAGLGVALAWVVLQGARRD